MRLHLDFGYFCWQLISVVQHNLEHDEESGADVHDIGSESRIIGFGPNNDEEGD